MSRNGVLLGLAIVFAMVFIQSCADDDGVMPVGPDCPRTGVGGVVTVAGRPADADLRVRLAVPDDWSYRWNEAKTNDEGRFFLPLPPGRYLVFATGGDLSGEAGWSIHGPAIYPDRPDTLVVEEDRETFANFRFGLARLAITVPESMQDRSGALQFYRWPVTRSRRFLVGRASIPHGSGVQEVTAALPVGAYAVRFATYSFSDETWMPGTPLPEGADSIVVPDGESELRAWTPCPGVATLRGSVHGSWETMVGDYWYRPQVEVFTEDSLQLSETGVEADGSFVFQFLQARRVRLLVRVGQVNRWMGGERFADVTSFAVIPNEETQVPPFRESGLIVRLLPPTPWSKVLPKVTLLDAGGRSCAWTWIRGHADAVMVPNLAGGTYRLRVEPRVPSEADWLGQWYDGADSAAAATPVLVPTDGGVATITVLLRARPGDKLP
jgi:hypothetical protein